MAITVQRAKKVGGSLMIRIPKDLAEIEQIKPGEAVQLEVHKLRRDWFGALKGLSSMKKEEKLGLHG